MAVVEIVVGAVGAVASLAAAAFWWASAIVKIPPFREFTFDIDGPVFPPIHNALTIAARWNARAAACAALAAVAGGVQFFLQLTRG